MLIKLREPYWNAYAKYGWNNGVEGYGVDITLIKKARLTGEDIEIQYKKTVYSVPVEKVVEFYKASPITPLFIAKRGKRLVQIPRTLLEIKHETHHTRRNDRPQHLHQF